MKESIVLLVLGACWAGYLAWYWRENRRATPHRVDGIRAFSSGLGSLGGSTARASTMSSFNGASLAPRTAVGAARRRRDVLVGLSAGAAVTFLAAISLGGLAVVLHVLFDIALLAYGYAMVQRRNVEAEREMKVHMLHPGERVVADLRERPADASVDLRDAAMAPAGAAARQVVNG